MSYWVQQGLLNTRFFLFLFLAEKSINPRGLLGGEAVFPMDLAHVYTQKCPGAFSAFLLGLVRALHLFIQHIYIDIEFCYGCWEYNRKEDAVTDESLTQPPKLITHCMLIN